MNRNTVDQQARDLLERIGVADAKTFSSGDLVELANLIDGKESLRQQLASLKSELKTIGNAIDDPRTDLTMTMVEVIADQHKERDQLREQVKMLREALRDCAYDESGFCINPDAAEALAATEPKS